MNLMSLTQNRSILSLKKHKYIFSNKFSIVKVIVLETKSLYEKILLYIFIFIFFFFIWEIIFLPFVLRIRIAYTEKKFMEMCCKCGKISIYIYFFSRLQNCRTKVRCSLCCLYINMFLLPRLYMKSYTILHYYTIAYHNLRIISCTADLYSDGWKISHVFRVSCAHKQCVFNNRTVNFLKTRLTTLIYKSIVPSYTQGACLT